MPRLCSCTTFVRDVTHNTPMACGRAQVGNWVYTYAVREGGLDDRDAALANSAFWGSFTAGRVLGVGGAGVVGAHGAQWAQWLVPISCVGGWRGVGVLGVASQEHLDCCITHCLDL